MALTGGYVIKRCSSSEEVRTITNFELTEGWMPAIDDHEIFYNTDPKGFFIGELNGQPISCISVVRYGENYAFVGVYIVLKEYRGRGYGLAIWKHALGSIPMSYNIELNAISDKVSMYKKWDFKEAFVIHRVQTSIERSIVELQNCIAPVGITVQLANQIKFDELSSYDDAAFGAPHQRFLKGLLDGPNTITLAATNTAGEVVGFVAARKTILKEEGWRVAPLCADNGQIARAILKEILQEVTKDSPERKILLLDLSVDVNSDACALAEELKTTCIFEMRRMYTKSLIDFTKEKVYSFSDTDV